MTSPPATRARTGPPGPGSGPPALGPPTSRPEPAAPPDSPGTDRTVTVLARLYTLAAPAWPVLRRAAAPITPLGAGALAVGTVSAAAALVTGWAEFLVLALTLGVALAGAALFLIGRSSYRVGIDMHAQRVVAGEPASCVLTCTNTGGRRLLPARIEVPVGGSLASFRIPALAPHAEVEELFVIPTERRSVVTVGPAVSVRGDALGLLRRQVRWTAAQALFVHPRTVPLAGASTGMLRDLEGQPTRDLSSNDVSFHALRPYTPGDDRRYVHWRTSARTGALMVRQFEETRRTHVALALSLDPADYVSTDEFEMAVSVAASVGVQAIREERPESADDVRRARRSLATFSAEMAVTDKQIKTLLFSRIYRHPEVMRVRANAASILTDLYHAYMDDPQLMQGHYWVDRIATMPETARARHVGDYLAGMTDNYAVNTHRRLFDHTPELR